ncbi:hypothetical protein NE619_09000 [Anaerovorax odorimutans]|uniref:Uncharacterized protein n=1 Tax=Anaerovorax odorimutans TaxID=109327 RepID=A0ABT1RNU8_9FIRM|nr:hypothetical protein [Anaerovorax odorimutans]
MNFGFCAVARETSAAPPDILSEGAVLYKIYRTGSLSCGAGRYQL